MGDNYPEIIECMLGPGHHTPGGVNHGASKTMSRD